jgi:glycosyltransferase involved in cell wall biosynthesis
MTKKPSMLVVSHVLPYPGNAGQQMRVLNKLIAFRNQFDVTFLTSAPSALIDETKRKLEGIVKHAIVLPSITQSSFFARAWHKMRAKSYSSATGLKESNYNIGEIELSPARVSSAIQGLNFNIAVFEYWHAYKSVATLQEKGIYCVLDMHDLLWQSFKRMTDSTAGLSEEQKQAAVEKYRTAEESAWKEFDAIIAINKAEEEYLHREVDAKLNTYYAPMGTDLSHWRYQWDPANPPRLAYYGGLGNPYNQQDAEICLDEIMPSIWRTFPEAELWLVGSDPSKELQARADGKRVFVTGYVERVQDILKSISLVLCPFSGTFGFRSRLIEVMALGIPVIASTDAAYGMDMPHGEGIWHCESTAVMENETLRLLGDSEALKLQSKKARATVERLYSFEESYGRLSEALYEDHRERMAEH